MSLEAIKQVTQGGAANQARKIEAQAQAKRLVAEAERAGRARLEQARAQAEEQAPRPPEGSGGKSGPECADGDGADPGILRSPAREGGGPPGRSRPKHREKGSE